MIIEDKYLIKSIQSSEINQHSFYREMDLNIELIGYKTSIKLSVFSDIEYIRKNILNIYKNNNNINDKMFINGKFYVGEEWLI